MSLYDRDNPHHVEYLEFHRNSHTSEREAEVQRRIAQGRKARGA